jgi:hypothetical protein
VSKPMPQPHISWIGLGLLGLLGIFLAVRTEHGIGLVLARRHAGSQSQPVSASDLSARIGAMAARDSLEAAAQPGERDPFRDPPPRASRQVLGTVAGSPSAQAEVSPVARAVLYDRVDSRVQLSVGPDVSAWLRTGDAFQGWTVVRITRATITLAQGERQLILPSP